VQDLLSFLYLDLIESDASSKKCRTRVSILCEEKLKGIFISPAKLARTFAKLRESRIFESN
jgi:hypothetical protein